MNKQSWTDDHTAKYEPLQKSVGILPWSDRSLIELTGDDRSEFLHNLSTANVKALKPGKGAEAFFCNVQGKVLAHVFLFCHEDSMVIETVGGQAQALLAHLDKYLIAEDVELKDRSSDWEQWLLAGPDAPKMLADFWIDPYEVSIGEYLDHCTTKNGWVIRSVLHGGDPSYLIQCPAGVGGELVAKCVEGGAIEGDALIADALRLENGVPQYGRDIDEKRLPQEVARDELAISFNKGCYLGQETVARIDALGHVNWQLVTVKLGDGSLTAEDLPAAESELTLDDKVVGHVRSASWSPKHQAPIAFAVVRREHVESGATLRLGETEVTKIG